MVVVVVVVVRWARKGRRKVGGTVVADEEDTLCSARCNLRVNILASLEWMSVVCCLMLGIPEL